MKSKLMILALACLVSSAAQAQTQEPPKEQPPPKPYAPVIPLVVPEAQREAKPTLVWYGAVDVYAAAQNTGAGYFLSLGSGGFNGSRLGFKGEAPLTQNVSAVYVAEAGINIDLGDVGNANQPSGINSSGASSGGHLGNGAQFFSRQIFAGLRSPYGTVTVGRQYSPNYIIAAGLVLPWAGLYGVTAGLTTQVGMPTRVNNSIYYVSPLLSGLRLQVGGYTGNENNTEGNVAVGTAFTNAKAGRGGDAGLFFKKGGLGLNAGAWYVYNTTFAATETELAIKKGWQVGGSYDVLGVFKLYGEFTQGEISGGNYQTVTKTLSKTTSYAGSLMIPWGKAGFAANYAKLDDKSLLNKDAEQFGVQAWYDIKPQSHVYAAWGYMLNHGNSTYNVVDSAGFVATSIRPGAEGRSFQLGFAQEF